MPELLCLALFPEHSVPGLCVRLGRLFTGCQGEPRHCLVLRGYQHAQLQVTCLGSRRQALLHPPGVKNFGDLKLFR